MNFSKNYQCFEKLYQTLERVFHQISKHFDVKLCLVFSTHFSVLGYLMKLSSLCLIRYIVWCHPVGKNVTQTCSIFYIPRAL